MQVTITTTDAKEAARLLAAMGSTTTTATTTSKRRAAAEVEDEEVTTDEEEIETDDATEEDGPTLAQVIAAGKAFVKRHGDDKRAILPILKKFKVTTVHDLDEGDFAAVIKALKK